MLGPLWQPAPMRRRPADPAPHLLPKLSAAVPATTAPQRHRGGGRRTCPARKGNAPWQPFRPAPPTGRRDAVIYQVYPRSFADGDGDGTGDLAGVRARLPYLAELGVDAVWFTPGTPPPMVDGGYDVADYRAVDLAFGTPEEAEKLIAECRRARHPRQCRHRPQPRPDQHFLVPPHSPPDPAAPSAPASTSAPGAGRTANFPPNDWLSQFASTWTRVPDGEWYLHLFTPEQPGLQLAHPDAPGTMRRSCAFWFARGSRAHGSTPRPCSPLTLSCQISSRATDRHLYIDLDEIHDIYHALARDRRRVRGRLRRRGLAARLERFARYLRPDELHTA